jgi:hypothetical protein
MSSFNLSQSNLTQLEAARGRTVVTRSSTRTRTPSRAPIPQILTTPSRILTTPQPRRRGRPKKKDAAAVRTPGNPTQPLGEFHFSSCSYLDLISVHRYRRFSGSQFRSANCAVHAISLSDAKGWISKSRPDQCPL